MARNKQSEQTGADTVIDPTMSEAVIEKWRRLTPDTRNVLARVEGREPLATNLRKARENRGLSQDAVARKLRLSRSLVAQIELANRPVSADELAKLADLYGTPAIELAGTRVDTGDPVTSTLFNLAPSLLKAFDAQSQIRGVLGTAMEASQLERLLERPSHKGPPPYSAPAPRTLADAVRQGEEVAEHERRRLGVWDVPLSALADFCAAEGMPVFALTLPDEVSSLFVAHASVGVAIIVNQAHDPVRQRYAIAHAYAHAVFEPVGTVRACTSANEKELVERRAAAFASAFLLPGAGVEGFVRTLGKGQGSRQVQWVLDGSANKPVRAEERSMPGSQTVTYLDVAEIARRFGAEYRVTVSRLLSLGVLSEPDSARLFRLKLVELGHQWLDIFGAPRARTEATHKVVVPADAFVSDIGATVTHMALEAYRRGLVTKADLAERVLTLRIPGLSDSQLSAFAEAIR